MKKIVLLMTFLLPLVARGESRAERLMPSIGLQYGSVNLTKTNDTGYNTRTLYGVNAGLWSRWLGLGLRYDRFSFSDGDAFLKVEDRWDWYEADIKVRYPQREVYPYLRAGLGLANHRVQLTIPGSQSTSWGTEYGTALGGGIEGLLGTSLGLGLDSSYLKISNRYGWQWSLFAFYQL